MLWYADGRPGRPGLRTPSFHRIDWRLVMCSISGFLVVDQDADRGLCFMRRIVFEMAGLQDTVSYVA